MKIIPHEIILVDSLSSKRQHINTEHSPIGKNSFCDRRVCLHPPYMYALCGEVIPKSTGKSQRKRVTEEC